MPVNLYPYPPRMLLTLLNMHVAKWFKMAAGDQGFNPHPGAALPFVPGAEQPMGGHDGRLPHQQVNLL